MASAKLLKTLAVTAELCGRTFSEAAAEIFVADLSAYPEDQVIGALAKCRREVKGLLTVQDVISRLDDGRPGPEEAWAMMPFDERQSVVWTAEMSQAFGVCGPLLEAGDRVAARMAFKETYLRLVQEARGAGIKVRWYPSLGHDVLTRQKALDEAAALGRITHEHAESLVPRISASDEFVKLIAESVSSKPPADIRAKLEKLRDAQKNKTK